MPPQAKAWTEGPVPTCQSYGAKSALGKSAPSPSGCPPQEHHFFNGKALWVQVTVSPCEMAHGRLPSVPLTDSYLGHLHTDSQSLLHTQPL